MDSPSRNLRGFGGWAVDILFLYRDNKNNTYMLFVQ